MDFYLSSMPNAKVAKRFLLKALKTHGKLWSPHVINTDKAECYGQAIRTLKHAERRARVTEHWQVKYLNNIVESNRSKLKCLIKPMLGFKSMGTAYATAKG